jgi:DNA-binding NtrC family response regulator
MAAIASVLIIDDEETARQTLADIFKDEGVSRICLAVNAEEGLKILEKESFALIVCDFFLPGMNGIGFMGKLRLKGDHTPILLISGIPDKTEIMRASRQLRLDFLAKPFTPSELMAAVERILHH